MVPQIRCRRSPGLIHRCRRWRIESAHCNRHTICTFDMTTLFTDRQYFHCVMATLSTATAQILWTVQPCHSWLSPTFLNYIRYFLSKLAWNDLPNPSWTPGEICCCPATDFLPPSHWRMNSSQSTHAYKHLLRHTLRLSRHHCYVNKTCAHAVYDNSDQVPWVCGECAVGNVSSSSFIYLKFFDI